MDTKIKEYINIFTDEYLKPFHAFAVNRTNDAYEAEELAQEIAYQCIVGLNKNSNINDLNAFLWSIAHNTYKRWSYKKRNSKNKLMSIDDNLDLVENIADMSPRSNIEKTLLKSEDMRLLRKELSLLTNFYRKTLVCFYYDELSISEIADKLSLSVEMVKFYLQKGRIKLKEAYIMSKEFGEKSFNPSPFAVYRGTLGGCSVDVWKIFSRKLPCQIALICHDSPKKLDEICLETGVPAAYIEDEIKILVDSELLICPVKDKYQTNFFILRKNALDQLKEQLSKMYEKYVPTVIEIYEKYLPEMKKCDIFKYDAEDKRYAWFFEDKVVKFDYSNLDIADNEYMTLADGAIGIVFAQEDVGNDMGKDHCSIRFEDNGAAIHASSAQHHHFIRQQDELCYSGKEKISALYDIYKGNTKDSGIELYAQLIEQGYAFKENGNLICDVAVHTEKSKKLFEKINSELNPVLAPLCKEIYESVSKIVTLTIPPQLKKYIHAYTATEVGFYAGSSFMEALYNKSFVTPLEDDDKTPVSCWID